MDRSPIDVDVLARMANELFKGAAGDIGDVPSADVPTPTELPSALQAAPAASQTHVATGAGALPNLPAGGAMASPFAPPSRPAYGRAVSAEPPGIGFGTAQPPFGTAPGPDLGFGVGAFNPLTIPGFGPIPHVEDGFDVDALLGAGTADRFGAESAQALAPTQGILGDAAAVAPLEAEAGRFPGLAGASRSGFAPNQPGFGRAVSAEPPVVGYGSGQPRTGTPPAPSAGHFDPSRPHRTTALADGALGQGDFGSLGQTTIPQSLRDLDPAAFERGAAPYLAPSDRPGLAAPQPPAPYPGASPAAASPAAPRARNIDRPTPSPFEFTDVPHLGEFDEEKILRASLDPQRGAPAVEGLVDRATPVAHPYAGTLQPSAQPSFYFLDDGMDYFGNDVPKVPRPSATPFNAEAVRSDFPILRRIVNGHPLVWLDNGATTQKPQPVIDRLARFYETENSNISRSAHTLAAEATNAYEDARKTVQHFINAPSVEEIVFARGTTELINLVAQSFGRRFIKQGDEILLTHGEHHANIVPWYNLAKEVGAQLRVAPFDDNGDIMLDAYEQLLSHKTRIVATTHVANALGTVMPVKAMAEMAHRHGVPVLVDGAQSVSHMPIDVQDLDCDFFVFSGHKVFAPTGIGALYGKKALLDQMPPWQGGGNMIQDVTFERITFQPPPGRFEAGTSNIADAIGLAEALKYVEKLGMTNIQQYEHGLVDYALKKLETIKGLKVIGRPKERAGVISFLLDGKEPVEVGKALDAKGIAVRAGHHCALPILRRYGVEATVRPAFAMYNTFEDADRLAAAVREIAAD